MDALPPLLDQSLADQWFAPGEDVDQDDARRLIQMLRGDVMPRFGKLVEDPAGMNAGEADKEFHRLRGAIASFGFSRSARHLLKLEKEWGSLTPDQRNEELQGAYSSMKDGLAELLKRFPYLNE